MKLNNKGFAISTIMYMILIMAIILIALTLLLLSSRKLILDRTKKEALDNIYEKYICRRVTAETASYDTAGNLVGKIPTGDYNPGDEYICEVKEGTSYHFYVLSVEGSKVNLILDRNVYYNEATGTSGLADENNSGSVTWNETQDASYGPVTAIAYLNNATSDWTNIQNLNEIHDDESGVYFGFELNGKARLPKKSEVMASEVGCSASTGSCPLWLVNYMSSGFYTTRIEIDGISSYWTLSSSTTTNAIIVTNVGFPTPTTVNGVAGVRPVITVLKSDIL